MTQGGWEIVKKKKKNINKTETKPKNNKRKGQINEKGFLQSQTFPSRNAL